MAIDIKFSYVCEKQFYELKGESNQVRFCEKCQFQVFNLDPLDDEQRLVLFEGAAKNNKRICVSATLPIENQTPCSESQRPPIPVQSIRLGGEPAIPSSNILARERARIEQLKANEQNNRDNQSWWEKLKFW